eukprot:3243169-Rhodomonas_salina.2
MQLGRRFWNRTSSMSCHASPVLSHGFRGVLSHWYRSVLSHAFPPGSVLSHWYRSVLSHWYRRFGGAP